MKRDQYGSKRSRCLGAASSVAALTLGLALAIGHAAPEQNSSNVTPEIPETWDQVYGIDGLDDERNRISAALAECGDLAVLLSSTVGEAVDTYETCVRAQLNANAEPGESILSGQAKVLPAFAPAAYTLYWAVAALVLRSAPAVHSKLVAYVGKLPRSHLQDAKVKELSKDLIKFLKDHGFKCSSSTNPLTCRK